MMRTRIRKGAASGRAATFAGEVVNMAMLDALDLADCLLSDDHADTRSAIAAYETRMRERNAEAMAGTRENTEMIHSPDGQERLVAFFRSVQQG